MMAQPTAAAGVTLPAGNAIQGGLPAAGADGAPADLLVAFNGAVAAPFSQALLALTTGADAAAGISTTTGAPTLSAVPTGQLAGAAAGSAAAPQDAAAVLPADLLVALFPPEASPVASAREVLSTGARGGNDDEVTAEIAAGTDKSRLEPTAAPAAAPDPGAALLAVVLQWLQQQSMLAPRSALAADSGATDGRVAAEDATARNLSGATAQIIPDAGGAAPASARTDGSPEGNVTAIIAAAPGAELSGRLTDYRDPDARGATGQRPAAAPATSAGNAVATVMDMAAALRAVTAASPNPVERSVATPVHERHWPQALAAQVLILSNERVQAATLRLSPAHLGPLEVHIDLQDANVNVTFTAAHVETRVALEQAMPQLRAVLAGAGLTLSQATVQQQARRESQNPNGAPRAGGDLGEQPEALAAVTRALGMVDEYV